MPCRRLKIYLVFMLLIRISCHPFVAHKASASKHNHYRRPEKRKTPFTAMQSSPDIRINKETGIGSRHLHLLILIDFAAKRLRLIARDTRLPRHASEAEPGTPEAADKLEFFA
jgi:hypothetical protein